MRKLDLEEVKSFIEAQTPETKIYIGCDSERIKVNKVWYADYITAIVVHINGNNGCKLFGEVVRERDYDQKQNKPRYRLMNEVYKVSELYLKLADVLVDRNVEVHLKDNSIVVARIVEVTDTEVILQTPGNEPVGIALTDIAKGLVQVEFTSTVSETD